MTKRNNQPEFKAKVALDSIRKEMTLSVLSVRQNRQSLIAGLNRSSNFRRRRRLLMKVD